jgi:hypothetical protein
MATVNGVWDGRVAWSPTYTEYQEYKYIEDIVGNFVSLIQVTGNTTTNTNLEDMFCNVLIEHGVTTVNVNTSLIAFTYLLTNCISGSL